MAVNGIRVSALPEMSAAELTTDDYLIINDGNTNTRRVSFENFLGAVDTNITEIKTNVTSVNSMKGDVLITAIGLGAATTGELQAVSDKLDATDVVVLKNTGDISTLTTNLSATDTSVGIGDADTLAAAKEYTDVKATDTLATTVTNDGVVLADSKAYTDNALTGLATFEQGAAADTALQAADLVPYSTTDQANALYASKGTGTNSVDGNATDIATNTAAIADLADGSTDLVSPKVNGVAVTATGADLNQLTGVTLGSAASADTGAFATAAQGALAGSALQDATAFATAAQGALAGSALQAVPAEYETATTAAGKYAPISVTGDDGNAAKVVTDAIGALDTLAAADDTTLTTPGEIKAALDLIIIKVNAIINA